MPTAGRWPSYSRRTAGDAPAFVYVMDRLRAGRTRIRLPGLSGTIPAPAGMFPSCLRRRRSCRTAPRARGDVPLTEREHEGDVICSPRPRGCSQSERGAAIAVGLLPAPAGMCCPYRHRVKRANRPYRVRRKNRGQGPGTSCAAAPVGAHRENARTRDTDMSIRVRTAVETQIRALRAHRDPRKRSPKPLSNRRSFRQVHFQPRNSLEASLRARPRLQGRNETTGAACQLSEAS